MTEGIKIYKTQDLVLKVKQNYDPAKLNLKKWVSFLDALCGDREFQKEAIRDAIIFIVSGEYRSIEDLVEENFRKNDELQYSSTLHLLSFCSPSAKKSDEVREQAGKKRRGFGLKRIHLLIIARRKIQITNARKMFLRGKSLQKL